MNLAEAADKYIPRLMSGLMARDWEKAKSAMFLSAVEYHQQNGLEFHENLKLVKTAIKSEESRAIASAIFWVIDKEQGGAAL